MDTPDPAFAAHLEDVMGQRANVRARLRAAQKELGSILLALKPLYDASCGGDCCIDFWQHRHASAFIQDAERAVHAACALTGVEA
jgi:hypothetical protein